MSAPAPCTVQVVPLRLWLPTSAGLPTSAQDHPAGQGLAGGWGDGVGPGGPAATPEKVAVLTEPLSPELTATPAMTAEGRTSVTVDPGMSVYEVPSADVAACKTSPRRCISRNTGPVPACVPSTATALPLVVRSSTMAPFGVTSTA